MKILRLAATAGLLTCIATTSILAGSDLFSFGSTHITVRADDAYCAANPTQPFDKAWLDIQIKANAGSNEVVGAFMLCDELAQLRRGVPINLSRWIIMLSPTQGQTKASAISGYSRQDFLDLMEQQFQKGIELDMDDINKRVDKATQEVLGTADTQPIKIQNDNTPMLLGKTKNGVYAGMTMQMVTEEGPMKVGAVISMTLVDNHMLSINLYRNFETPDTINQLLVEGGQMIDAVAMRND